MTQDEQMDRLERSLRLFLERDGRARRESRKSGLTADKLGAYVKALQERDCAKAALDAKPGDPEAEANLRKTEAILNRSREELKH